MNERGRKDNDMLDKLTIDLSQEQLEQLADYVKANRGYNWLAYYLRILGVKPIVHSGLEDTILQIVSDRCNCRQTLWRLAKLFKSEEGTK